MKAKEKDPPKKDMKELFKTKEELKDYLKNLLTDIVLDKPENVALYMANWLQKREGYVSSGLTVDEKAELENLRRSISRYRKFDDHQTSPETTADLSDDEKDDIDTTLDDKQFLIAKAPKERRPEICGDIYGEWNKKPQFNPQKIEKTPEEFIEIRSRLLSCYFFSILDNNVQNLLIDSMEKIEIQSGNTLCTQGVESDYLYLIWQGQFEAYQTYIIDKQPTDPILVKVFQKGEIFGDEVLLYPCQFPMTVRATTDGAVYRLDRNTYQSATREGVNFKINHYNQILKKMKIFSGFQPKDFDILAENVKEGIFFEGDSIFKEGDLGDLFYYVEKGECSVLKSSEPGKPKEEIKVYKEGDCFGERAMFKGEERIETIIAKSNIVKLISVDRLVIKNKLYTTEQFMKNNEQLYQYYYPPIPETKQQEKRKSKKDINTFSERRNSSLSKVSIESDRRSQRSNREAENNTKKSKGNERNNRNEEEKDINKSIESDNFSVASSKKDLKKSKVNEEKDINKSRQSDNNSVASSKKDLKKSKVNEEKDINKSRQSDNNSVASSKKDLKKSIKSNNFSDVSEESINKSFSKRSSKIDINQTSKNPECTPKKSEHSEKKSNIIQEK